MFLAFLVVLAEKHSDIVLSY